MQLNSCRIDIRRPNQRRRFRMRDGDARFVPLRSSLLRRFRINLRISRFRRSMYIKRSRDSSSFRSVDRSKSKASLRYVILAVEDPFSLDLPSQSARAVSCWSQMRKPVPAECAEKLISNSLISPIALYIY